MQFKSLLFSFLLALTLGFAFLTQAEDAPRGPKITNKVRGIDRYSLILTLEYNMLIYQQGLLRH